MNVAQAKKIQLFDLLASWGHHPTTTHSNGDVWYLSPFRSEKTASFKINVEKNVWFDHGEGVGGNIIDFVMKYKNTDFRGALATLDTTRLSRNDSISLQPQERTLFDKPLVKESVPEILEIKPVFSYALKNYLKDERFIKPEIGYKLLREVRYKLDDKEYYALGFKNRSGGWELRNSLFQNSIGAKDITTLDPGHNRVHAFEGFMDYLTALTIQGNDRMGGDVIVLNSVNLKKRAIDHIRSQNYTEIYTYFDNDTAGKKTLEAFKAELPGNIIPCNHLYDGFKDYNKYWQELMKQKNIPCHTKK